MIGSRDGQSAYELMQDVAARLRNRVQLTTDGHKPYLEAVEAAFGMDIDYAMLQKIYGADPGSETRYSPAVCIGCKAEDSRHGSQGRGSRLERGRNGRPAEPVNDRTSTDPATMSAYNNHRSAV